MNSSTNHWISSFSGGRMAGFDPSSTFGRAVHLLRVTFASITRGGWHVMLPNGAAPSSNLGAEFGFHGEATHLPWDYRIEVDQIDDIEVKFTLRTVRLPLFIEKTISLERGSSSLRIHERIVNETGQSVEILWGHHPTFGWPFLESGCRVLLPTCEFVIGDAPLPGSRLASSQKGDWPFALSKDGDTLDLSIICGPDVRSQDFIRLEESGRRVVLDSQSTQGHRFPPHWDKALFPVLGFWQVFRGATGYPWVRHELSRCARAGV